MRARVFAESLGRVAALLVPLAERSPFLLSKMERFSYSQSWSLARRQVLPLAAAAQLTLLSERRSDSMNQRRVFGKKLSSMEALRLTRLLEFSSPKMSPNLQPLGLRRSCLRRIGNFGSRR